MTLNTQASPAAVLRLLEEGLFTRRNRERFYAESWTKDEVFLVPRQGTGRVIVTVRNGKIIISPNRDLGWIEREVVRVISQADPSMSLGHEHKMIQPLRRVNHPHLRGNCSLTARPPKEIGRTPKTAYLLKDVITEIEYELRGKVIFTETARRTAGEYRFVDLAAIKHALLALGEAAVKNAQGGLKMTWSEFLKARDVSFTPNSSKTAKTRFREQYEVLHNGVRLLTEAHVCFGTGKPPYFARIYLRQPDKPGCPVIIGSMGPHLDTATR